MDVTTRIKELTDERNWTQYRLAKEAGLPQTTIANIFRRGTTPSVATLEMLCKAFNISMSDFFMEEADSKEHISSEEMRLIGYWNKLDLQQRQVVMNLLGNMNNKAEEK